MEIRSLEGIQISEIVQCLTSAFSRYFVPLPKEVSYWENRYMAARVDYSLSFGMFDRDQLVGFIINGVDQHEGKRTAFNSGTGVLEEYRGQGIVDKLYAHAFPLFKKEGIEKCMLEVIQENHRAIKVYERIGFHKKRKLCSYKGKVSGDSMDKIIPVSYEVFLDHNLNSPVHYSWDHMKEAVMISGERLKTFQVQDLEEKTIGFFVLRPGGQVVQLETYSDNHFSRMIQALGMLSEDLKLVNIPENRKKLIQELESSGFVNLLNQYEMEMSI